MPLWAPPCLSSICGHAQNSTPASSPFPEHRSPPPSLQLPHPPLVNATQAPACRFIFYLPQGTYHLDVYRESYPKQARDLQPPPPPPPLASCWSQHKIYPSKLPAGSNAPSFPSCLTSRPSTHPGPINSTSEAALKSKQGQGLLSAPDLHHLAQ